MTKSKHLKQPVEQSSSEYHQEEKMEKEKLVRSWYKRILYEIHSATDSQSIDYHVACKDSENYFTLFLGAKANK